MNQSDREQSGRARGQEPTSRTDKQQEQTDPQMTEWRGLTDSSEDLEPTLSDGTKSPDKAAPEGPNE